MEDLLKMKEIKTITLSTEVKSPNTDKKIVLKFPNSRMERNYHNITFSKFTSLEQEINTRITQQNYSGISKIKLSAIDVEKRSIMLTYLKKIM